MVVPPEDLLVEAAVVALTLVPVWWVTTQATTPFVAPSIKSAVDVAVSGFAFHLLCEEFGINEWYLTHGYAFRKVFTDLNKRCYITSYGVAMGSL